MVVSLVAGLCYDRLRLTNHHTARAMMAITIMAINTLPMSSLFTVGRRTKPARQLYSAMFVSFSLVIHRHLFSWSVDE